MGMEIKVTSLLSPYDAKLAAGTILEKLAKVGVDQKELRLLTDLMPVFGISGFYTHMRLTGHNAPIEKEYPEQVVYKNDSPSEMVVTLEVEKSREGEHREHQALVGEFLSRAPTDYENQCGMDFSALCLQ